MTCRSEENSTEEIGFIAFEDLFFDRESGQRLHKKDALENAQIQNAHCFDVPLKINLWI